MKAIRDLEKDIINYQQLLRSHTQNHELTAYREIGKEKLQNFAQQWEQRLDEFHRLCSQKLAALDELHTQQTNELEEKLAHTVEHVKPKPILRELQTQEKLLAVNERYYEAQQIRNELSLLEDSEMTRLSNLVEAKHEAQRKALAAQQAKERRQLEIKNRTNLSQLTIQQEHERVRLHKEINLHHNDITKVHKLATRYGQKVGSTRDELRRVKMKSKQMQLYIQEKKQARGRSLETTANLPHTAPLARTHRSSVFSAVLGFKDSNPLKLAIRNTTKFHIKSDAVTERPVNVSTDIDAAVSFTAKTGKILSQSRKLAEGLPSITALYTKQLEPLGSQH